MSNSKINFAAVMILVHRAITRGLDVTIERSAAFVQAGITDAATQDGFATYVRTLGWVINAHHMSEDNVIFPFFRSKLPDAPFDELSANHLVISEILKEIQMTVEPIATQAQPVDALNVLNRSVTRLKELWHPHIAKEQLYIYDPDKIDAVMKEDEQIKLLTQVSEHSLKQADPGFLLPFILYNLPTEGRAYMAKTMPPAVVQEMLPGPWQEKWKPMKPFFLD